ncbi:hypothetical protein BH11BAC1_BH11BAC1_08150 [soil metagenome]
MNIRPYPSVLYYAAIVAVILFSFFSFSYAYYPFFNSDSALAVLMSFDYHFPADLYCWGQDRGGTLEMMLAHFFIQLFNSGPLLTASIIHYLLLIAGLAAAFQFVRKPFYRLALSIAWFFPSYFFIENVLYQFGIQFSLFMIALFFFSKVINSEKRKSLLLSLVCFFMILNAWVLDLGFIPAFFFIVFVIYYFFTTKKRTGSLTPGFTTFFNIKNIILVLLWITGGIFFIGYAKIRASGINSFPGYVFNNPEGIFNVLLSILNSIRGIMLFQWKPMESLYFYSAIFFLTLFSRTNRNAISNRSFFSSFLLWQSLLSLLLLLFIRQVELSIVPSRYFTGCYLSLVVSILMKMDESTSPNMLLKVSLSTVLTFSVFSSLYESYFPKKLGPMVKNFQALEKLQPVGVIGSYWNSYVFSGIDPVHIKATAHEGDNVRNIGVAYETLEQPTLLLIQNEWLRNFPDSISQFGTLLIKNGDPFLIGTYFSWDEENPVIACQYKTAR